MLIQDASKPVLLVDDSADLLSLFSMALTGEGYRVQTAANGRAALEMLRQGLSPSLIFLDRFMDVMGGDEFIEAYKQQTHETGSRAPIVLMTGSEVFKRPEAVAHVLRKPVNLDQFLGLAQKYSQPEPI